MQAAMLKLHTDPDVAQVRNRRLAERGQSTLFNALTKAGIAAENYPF